MNPSPRDAAGIPVLTEIISPTEAADLQENQPAVQSFSPDAAASPMAAPAPGPAVPPMPPVPHAEHAAGDSLEQRARSTWSNEEWSRLEEQVRERILRQMMARIDKVLEERVRDALADSLQLAVGRLADDIRASLQDSIEATVARAVADEIEKIRL